MSSANQIKHLNERISCVHLPHPGDPKPPEVLKAEKIIEEWEKEVDQRTEKWREQFRKERTEAYEAVQFKSAEEALKIVRAFEEKYR